MKLFRASLIIASLALGSPGAAAATRPDIVLLMADDQGWGETGYNGHPYVKTPVLDTMARSALKLERFYSGAPNCTLGSVPSNAA